MRLPRLLVLLSLLSPAALADDAPRPRMEVAEKQLSFGEVVQGQQVRVPLALKNAGQAPLVITHVETTCDCSVARLPAGPIAPGATGEVLVEFDSRERTGVQGFEVYVYSNDPAQADRGLYCTHFVVKGEVRSEFRLSPRGAYFGEFLRGSAAVERVVKVVGTGPARDGFQARLAGELPSFFEAELRPLERGVEVKVRLLPHAPPGEHLHQVVLATGIEEQPELRVPIAVTVVDRLLAPGAIVLGDRRRGEPAEPRRIPLERLDADGLEVKELQFDPKLLTVTAVPLTPRRVDLLVTVAPEAPAGLLAAPLVVRLDLPSHPRLEIPVFARVRPRIEVEPLELLPRDGAAAVTLRGGPVTATRFEPADAAWSCEVSPAPSGHRLTIRAAAPGAPAPRALVVETGVPGEERVTIPVRSE